MIKIYTLSHPITKEVRYIGKTASTLKARYWNHISSPKFYRTYKSNWIKSLLDQDLKPEIELLDEVEDDLGNFYERYWISQFKTWGFNLVNATDGGEGTPGRKVSKEFRQLQSKLHKGISPSLEVRKKISDSLKGIKQSLETIEKRCRSRQLFYRKKEKTVYQYDLTFKLLNKFLNPIEASEKTGIDKRRILSCLCGASMTTYKQYRWSYKLITV